MQTPSPLRAKYGPWALVTGASDGIGKAMAERLAVEGFDLVLVARRREPLDRLADACRALHGVQVRVFAQDLSAPGAVDAVMEACAGLEVGLLVAAAGFGTSGPFLGSSLETELGMLTLNCAVPFAMAHGFGRAMAKRGRGGIVLMSSLLAFQGVAGAAHYAATKAYIQTLVEGLRKELAGKGVSVIASAPGPVLSGFGARARMAITTGVSPETVARGTLKALGRWTTARPGFLSKALEHSMTFLPRPARTRILSGVMSRMTRRPGPSQEAPR